MDDDEEEFITVRSAAKRGLQLVGGLHGGTQHLIKIVSPQGIHTVVEAYRVVKNGQLNGRTYHVIDVSFDHKTMMRLQKEHGSVDVRISDRYRNNMPLFE